MHGPNISIIMLDTMRYDAFAELAGSNRLSRVADFTQLGMCISPASWTLPSHASLFTGMYPSEHGSHETTKVKSLDIDRVKLRKSTFIGDLKRMGYTAYGVSANPYIHPVYGFDEFDVFKEESYFTDVFGSAIEVSPALKPLISKYRNVYGNDVIRLSAAVMRDDPALFMELAAAAMARTPGSLAKKLKAKYIDGWPIEKGGSRIARYVRDLDIGSKRSFVFMNLMEAHDPYIGMRREDFDWSTPFMKAGVSGTVVERWKALYGKASKRAYGYAAQITRDLLDRFGDDQVIIITSDHGQAFNEHGFVGHGTVLYDEVVRIPFAVKMPRGFGADAPRLPSSLVNVREFISGVLRREKNALRRLCSKAVYAESFGVPANVMHVRGIDKRKVMKYERYQRRSFRA